MNVAFVLPNLSGGGAERVFVDLANDFAAAGHVTHLILFSQGGEYGGLVSPAVRVTNLGTATTAASVGPLRRALRALGVEIVFSTLKHVSIGIEAMRLASGRPFRHVVRAANTYDVEIRHLSLARRLAFRAALRFVHATADRTVCVSRGVAEDLVQRFGVRRARIAVIENPVYDDRMRRLAEESTGAPALDRREGFRVVAAGRLVPQKGFDVLLRAFAAALANRDAHLYLLGDGPDRESLGALAAALGIEAQVTFTGFVANPFAYLGKASLFVLSSRYEGLPNVLIQALCLGVRVLATDCESGPAEIVGSNRSAGSLVPVDDVDAMATRLRHEFDERPAAVDPEPFRRRYDKRARCADYERLVLALVARGADEPGDPRPARRG